MAIDIYIHVNKTFDYNADSIVYDKWKDLSAKLELDNRYHHLYNPDEQAKILFGYSGAYCETKRDDYTKIYLSLSVEKFGFVTEHTRELLKEIIKLFVNEIAPDCKDIFYVFPEDARPYVFVFNKLTAFPNNLLSNIPDDVLSVLNNLNTPVLLVDRETVCVPDEYVPYFNIISVSSAIHESVCNAVNVISGKKIKSIFIGANYLNTYTVPYDRIYSIKSTNLIRSDNAPSILVYEKITSLFTTRDIYLSIPMRHLNSPDLWTTLIVPCLIEQDIDKNFAAEISVEDQLRVFIYKSEYVTNLRVQELYTREEKLYNDYANLERNFAIIKSQLSNISKEIAQERQVLHDKLKNITGIQKELARIKAIPEVTNVQIDYRYTTDSPVLNVDIKELPCKSSNYVQINENPPVIGPYTVRFSLYPLDIRITNTGNPQHNFAHPHCRNGESPCLGNFAAIYEMLAEKQLYAAVASLIDGFLKSFNEEDSWGSHILWWAPKYGFEVYKAQNLYIDTYEYADEYYEAYGEYPATIGVCEYCGELLDNCICEYCPTCGERLEECGCCRCPNCRELLEDCVCERCPNCEELLENCECERCPSCGELLEDCECERAD